jgi:hypothetical protein
MKPFKENFLLSFKRKLQREMDQECMELFGEESMTMFNNRGLYNDDSSESEQCPHDKCITDGTKRICEKCNCEVDILDYEAEWKFKGHGVNNARCSRSKVNSKSDSIQKIFDDAKIFKELANERRKKMCEDRYNLIVGETDDAHGPQRKGIIAACLMYVLQEDGIVRQPKDFQKYFKITAKVMSKGISRYHMRFPESRTIVVTTKDLIHRITSEVLKIDKTHEENIIKLATLIEKSNAQINRSCPASLAPAIVYAYLCCVAPQYKQSLGISKQKFAGLVDLSQITITKLAKTIAQFLGKKLVEE